MRTLRAKHTPTNRWCQRIDSSTQKTEAQFAVEVAAQFALPVTDLSVVVTDWTEPQRLAETAAQATGTGEGGLAVLLATPAPLPPDWAGFQADLLATFTRRRLRTVVSAATFSAFLRHDAVAIKTDLDEMAVDAVITLAERDALYATARARRIPGF